MRTIHHVVDIPAPPDTVYRALTEESALAGWWTTKVRAAAGVGGLIAFAFVPEFNPVMTISELQPSALVEWKCTGGVEQWAGDTFRFELVDRGSAGAPATRLRFWQEYATELSDDDFGTYNFNWGYYLESLRLLCTEGKGKPFDS
jgi:uncharacterized protein YndB with AHSA1/START domain